MPRRILAIVNPISGRWGMSRTLDEVAQAVTAGGGQIRIATTTHSGHATELAANMGNGFDAVLVVGGDGTVSEVINGLQDRRTPVLILRTGTENLLARAFDMPTAAAQVARTLLFGRPFLCDAGVVNGRRFLAVAGAGFDAEVVEKLSHARRGHIGYVSYLGPLVRTFLSHRFPRFVVEVDGERIFDGRGLVLVGVIARYSLGLRILQKASPDDGLLDVCVLPCDTRAGLMGHAINVCQGRHLDRGGVIYRQVRKVAIDPVDSAAALQVDGDVAGRLPARFETQPGEVALLRGPD